MADQGAKPGTFRQTYKGLYYGTWADGTQCPMLVTMDNMVQFACGSKTFNVGQAPANTPFLTVPKECRPAKGTANIYAYAEDDDTPRHGFFCVVDVNPDGKCYTLAYQAQNGYLINLFKSGITYINLTGKSYNVADRYY